MSSQKNRKSKAPASKAKIETVLCQLEYQTEEEFIEQYAPNLSKTGIFIGTEKPKAVGALLRFELQLKDGTSLFKGKGEVTWNRDESPSGAPPGMGVKYLQLNDRGKSLIKKVMAYKAAHGDKFDKPSRYSMVPMANDDGEKEGSSHGEPKATRKSPEKQKKRKMKKLDLNELDAMLDGIALSSVSTKERVHYRRRGKPEKQIAPISVAPAPANVHSMEASADTLMPEAAPTPSRPPVPSPSVPPPSPSRPPPVPSPSVPPPSPSRPPEPEPSFGEVEEESPGLLFDEDEFPADAPGTTAALSSVPSYHPEPMAAVEMSPEVEVERISQEEISNIADVEELGGDMEIEAELLEPDMDSEEPLPKSVEELTDDELEGVLEDVYAKEPVESSTSIIQEDELDALLNALEESDESGDDAEDSDEYEELDVIEIDDDT